VAATLLVAPAKRVVAIPTGPDLTESLSGWTIIEEEGSAGEWRLVPEGTTTAPLSNLDIPSGDADGSFFLKDQTMPSAGILYYEFTLPETGEIEIYFEYFLQSQPEFSNRDTMSLGDYPNQQFRVDILTEIAEPFGAPTALANLLTTSDGQSTNTGWQEFSINLADITAVDSYRAGTGNQTAYLAFREVDNMGHFQVGIDDVRITDASAAFTLCDDTNLTAAEEFACAITNDPTTIVGAEEILAPEGASITRDFGTDSVLHTQSETTAGFGMVRYVPSEDDRAGTEEIPPIPSYSNTYCLPAGTDPCVSPAEEIVVESVQYDEYVLFESDGTAAGLYYVDFVVPTTISGDVEIVFNYFLQSQLDPAVSVQSNFSNQTAGNQQFIVELTEPTAFTSPSDWYTLDKLTLPKYQEMFRPDSPTTDGSWQSASINLSSLGFAVTSGDQLRLIFGAVATAGSAQIGISGLTMFANTADRSTDFSTYTTASRTLAGFPRQGSSYGVMSSGVASDFVTFHDSRRVLATSMYGGAGGVSQGLDASIYDATVLAIDLAAPLAATCLSIDVRFFSEEYPQFVGSNYNDAFIAELDPVVSLAPFVPTWTVGDNPDTTDDAETTWVIAPDNFAAAPMDATDATKTGVLSVNTTGTAWFRQGYAEDTPMNGGSIQLRATTPIDPSDPNILYLTVFDQGDGTLDTVTIIDALQFWPNPDCTGTFTNPDAVPSASPSATASIGVDVIAPQAAWGSLDVTEVSENDLPLNLVVTFDQPVHGFAAIDLVNVGDADSCEFSSPTPQDPWSGDALVPDGSAQEFEVVVTGCEPGELRPQLTEGSISGPSSNSGPSFSVTSFPITILPAGGGGGGGGGGTPTPTPSASSTPSASPSASIKPSPSASVKPTPTPSYSASPGASGGVSPSAAPSVKPSPTPSGSSSQSGGGGTSGNGDGGGWTLPTLPTLDQLANNFWFGVLLGAIVVLALWGLTNGLQRRVDSAPDEA